MSNGKKLLLPGGKRLLLPGGKSKLATDDNDDCKCCDDTPCFKQLVTCSDGTPTNLYVKCADDGILYVDGCYRTGDPVSEIPPGGFLWPNPLFSDSCDICTPPVGDFCIDEECVFGPGDFATACFQVSQPCSCYGTSCDTGGCSTMEFNSYPFELAALFQDDPDDAISPFAIGPAKCVFGGALGSWSGAIRRKCDGVDGLFSFIDTRGSCHGGIFIGIDYFHCTDDDTFCSLFSSVMVTSGMP